MRSTAITSPIQEAKPKDLRELYLKTKEEPCPDYRRTVCFCGGERECSSYNFCATGFRAAYLTTNREGGRNG